MILIINIKPVMPSNVVNNSLGYVISPSKSSPIQSWTSSTSAFDMILKVNVRCIIE